MPENPYRNERRQVIAEKDRAARLSDQSLIEKVAKELEQARNELAKCEIAARGFDSNFWKLLLDEFIVPHSSVHKILSTPQGEKRIEAEGEARGMLSLKAFVENAVRALPRWRAKVEELEEKLNKL